MAHYRCYLLGDDGKFHAAEDLDSESDGQAIERSRQILAGRPRYVAFELWQRGRRIHVEARRLLAG